MPRGRRIKKAIKSIANVGKNVARGVGPIIANVSKQAMKQIVNQVSQKMLTAGSAIMTGGIPFRESGMMAAATPVSSSGGINVSAPSANGRITRTGGPQSRTSSNGNAVVAHREYIQDVNLVESGFDLQFSFGINPGNPSLFPWLSQIASRYELYKFRRIRFVYEPQCGTSSNGTVFIAVDWDASDLPPLDKTQMMSYKNAVRSPLWFACEYSADRSDLSRLKTNYVLSGAAPSGTDIKTYDIGNLYVAIQSSSDTPQTAGELYVEYEVELITPQINNDPLSVVATQDPVNFVTGAPFSYLGDLVVELTCPAANQVQGYIGSTGFFIVAYNVYIDNGGVVLTSLTTNQGNTNLIKQSAQSVDLEETVGWFGVQVINPEQPAFLMDFALTFSASVSNTQFYVLPVSQSAMLSLSLQPVTPAANPRARLGRIRPFP